MIDAIYLAYVTQQYKHGYPILVMNDYTRYVQDGEVTILDLFFLNDNYPFKFKSNGGWCYKLFLGTV